MSNTRYHKRTKRSKSRNRKYNQRWVSLDSESSGYESGGGSNLKESTSLPQINLHQCHDSDEKAPTKTYASQDDLLKTALQEAKSVRLFSYSATGSEPATRCPSALSILSTMSEKTESTVADFLETDNLYPSNLYRDRSVSSASIHTKDYIPAERSCPSNCGFRHDDDDDDEGLSEAYGLCEEKRSCSFLELNERLPQIGDGSLTVKHQWRSADHLTMKMKYGNW